MLLARHHKSQTRIILNKTNSVFAGHDTTASIVQWALYQLSLSSNRHMLDRIRAEHDTVFSTSNFEDVGNVIINAPEEILGKLVYTNAVIKEALRLFPPAGTTRMSYGENFTVEWKGKQICMDNITLYIPHYIIHRDKKIWGENANLFDPDRFIEGSASYRKVPDSAYRPFEKGPRNCIGQVRTTSQPQFSTLLDFPPPLRYSVLIPYPR